MSYICIVVYKYMNVQYTRFGEFLSLNLLVARSDRSIYVGVYIYSWEWENVGGCVRMSSPS